MKKPILLLIGGLSLMATASLGQILNNYDSNAPVDVNADHAEDQGKQNRLILSGNVIIKQGGMTLSTQRATVLYSKSAGGSPQAQRFDAIGGVTVVNGDQSAHSDAAIYDVTRRLVTMVNGVNLQQGQNHVQGGRLVMDLVSGRTVMDGGVVGAAADGTIKPSALGRVTGHFTVPKRVTNQ